MSTFRKAVTVILDGTKYETTTSALDFRNVNAADLENVTLGEIVKIVHNALTRHHVDGIPHSLPAFLDLLDEVSFTDNDDTPAAADGGAETQGGDVDPTRPGTSDG